MKDRNSPDNVGSRETGNTRKKLSKKQRVAFVACSAIVFLLVVLIGGFQVLKAVGKSNLKKASESERPELVSDGLSDDEINQGIVYYNGEKYRYNSDIITILCVGVDSRETVEEAKMGQAGQADSIFLMVLDEKNKKMSLISIPRDTMTDISLYDVFGNYFTTQREHIALQYAVGDGKKISGKAMVSSVSKLMYKLPIHAYAAISLHAIGIVNDQVGGVTVEIPDDDEDYIAQSGYKAGQKVTLMGDKAIEFVRSRNRKKFATNNVRMSRQRQYMVKFVDALKSKTKSDLTFPVKIYQEASPYLNTDISVDKVSYLASVITGFSFDIENMYTIEGEVRQGEIYEEFIVDDKQLYELVLSVFYEKVSTGGFVEVTKATDATTMSVDDN